MAIQLKGITWNHSRGFLPMVATSQRFSEMNADVEISWEKRSLQEFADEPIQHLAEKYDLLVIDHPWAGFAADKQILVPLEQHLPAGYLEDQAANSVGKSHESYNFDGYQSALAIDAATPVASFRPDLLERYEEAVPQTWDELLRLAKRGLVIFPGIPIDSLMNFYMLCNSQGEDPCQQEDIVVSREMGLLALEQLRELAGYCTKEMFDWNPIKVYEAMTSRNDLAYCPFAYGYSNYSRPGYAKSLLIFDDMVRIGSHDKLRTTLGGTGLAISVRCQHIDAALQYAMYAASAVCQKTLYTEAGGQPGHRGAWEDGELNRRNGAYFKNTLPALDRAYMRPRYSGYLNFQDHAGDFVRDYMMHGGNADKVLEQMNRLYGESKRGNA
ncbi:MULTISPECIES: extracellular solute-binding protein [unclassified Paenibacillus]|uniref:extracellular solute-binding protein n=1 Tax=unclassified Paenibacillus TaxID=185978 RepID=UPI0036398A31